MVAITAMTTASVALTIARVLPGITVWNWRALGAMG